MTEVDREGGAGRRGDAEEAEALRSVKGAAAEAGLAGREQVVYGLLRRGWLRGVRLRRVVKVPAGEVVRLRALVEEERDAYSPEDVAADLGVGVGTARAMMGSGEIPSRRRVLGRAAGGLVSPRGEYLAWRRGKLGEAPSGD